MKFLETIVKLKTCQYIASMMMMKISTSMMRMMMMMKISTSMMTMMMNDAGAEVCIT